MYQTEFNRMHEMRKVVCSVYSEDQTILKVIDSHSYNLDEARLQTLNEQLKYRL